MSFPVIIQDDEIIFNVSPIKPNSVRTFYTELSWLTDYGLIIPLEYDSLMLKQGLIEGMLDLPSKGLSRSLLVDVHGSIKEIRIVQDEGKLRITTLPIHYGDGVKYVRSTSVEIEEYVTALFSMHYSNDQILEQLNNNALMCNVSVVRHSLDDITTFIRDNCKDVKKYHSSMFYE